MIEYEQWCLCGMYCEYELNDYYSCIIFYLARIRCDRNKSLNATYQVTTCLPMVSKNECQMDVLKCLLYDKEFQSIMLLVKNQLISSFVSRRYNKCYQ